eukprot:1395435-Amorphochlora_amoeboformis.AAC.1
MDRHRERQRVRKVRRDMENEEKIEREKTSRGREREGEREEGEILEGRGEGRGIERSLKA